MHTDTWLHALATKEALLCALLHWTTQLGAGHRTAGFSTVVSHRGQRFDMVIMAKGCRGQLRPEGARTSEC